MTLDRLTCPSCDGIAARGKDTFLCGTCGHEIKRAGGVFRHAVDESYFWCEVSRATARDMVEKAREQGWREALLGLGGMLQEEISRPGRDLWKHFLPLKSDSHVLDLGSGWGALTEGLARTYGSVTAMELTPERGEFSSIRMKQEGLTNVDVLISGGGRRLPFLERTFDLVVVNGVLEWLPDSNSGHPRDIQMDYLREILRVLRPGGLVYIGIENRWGYHYWFGKKEEHAGLRYISLLPRPLANVYSNAFNKSGYRTWTYGLSGYKRLVRDAGLEFSRALFPIPDYRWIDTVLPLDEKGVLLDHYRSNRSRIRSLAIRALIGLNIFPRIVPSYGIVAERPRE